MNIAVSMTVMEKAAYAETCDALSQDWIRFLDGLGVAPCLVSNRLSDPAQFCRQMNINGVLLTSGNDLGPRPGEEWKPSSTVSENRDRTEQVLIKYAVDSGTPLIGVCRGLQIINTYFGGGLERDLTGWTKGERHVRSDHRVEVVDPQYEASLGANSFVTNSFHNHGVTLESLAPSLKAIAVTEGRVVEALYHPDLLVLGTQWHPERESPEPGLGSELFRQWLEKCASAARTKPFKAKA